MNKNKLGPIAIIIGSVATAAATLGTTFAVADALLGGPAGHRPDLGRPAAFVQQSQTPNQQSNQGQLGQQGQLNQGGLGHAPQSQNSQTQPNQQLQQQFNQQQGQMPNFGNLSNSTQRG